MSNHNNPERQQWEEQATHEIYERVNDIFPQLEFKRKGSAWHSPKKIDGSDPSKPRHDKTIIKAQTPGIVIHNDDDQQYQNVFSVYAQLNNIERWEAIKQIADIINKPLPENPRAEIHKKRNDILASAQGYFTYCLNHSENGKKALEYLTQVRNWSTQQIEEAGLGVITTQKQLQEHLNKQGYTNQEIDQALKLNNAIGKSHILTIPRIVYGNITGFNFRCLGTPPNNLPKYLRQNKHDDDQQAFTYLPWQHSGDLILVEGELDALRANTMGIKNVVAIGRTKANEEQLRHAKERNFNKITICLDTEPAPEKQKSKAQDIEGIATKAEAMGFSVYVANLPDLDGVKTDLDAYLTTHTANDFLQLVNSNNATEMQHISTWRVVQLAKQYQGDVLSDKAQEDLLNGIVKIGLNVTPARRKEYYQQVNNFIGEYVAIDDEAINQTIERIKKAQELETQQHEYKTQTERINKQLANGDITISKATDITRRLIERITETGIDYEQYLNPTNWGEQIRAAREQPQGLETGYYTTHDNEKIARAVQQDTINQHKLILPAKAVTVVAGRSGHGKTLYMLNLALQVIKHQPGQRFHFFTYEMPTDQLLLRALNTYIGLTVGEVSKAQAPALREVFINDNYQYIQKPHQEATRQAVAEFKQIIDNGNLVLHDVIGKPMEDLNGIIKMLHKHESVNGVFIDYIQKISSRNVKGNAGIETLKTVANLFNELANQTGLPIITGAQYNRQVRHIADISEYALREADDIAHMASLILGIWNNNYEMVSDKDNDKENIQGTYGIPATMYTKVLKNRFAALGAQYLQAYNDNTQSLSTYDQNNHTYEPRNYDN